MTKVKPGLLGDENKNKTEETITGTMSDYGFEVGASGYDDEDRLINWERDDTNLDQAWSLSLVGDWNSITENTSTQNRTHGDAHELATAASQSVTHDVKGNITSIPAALRSGSDPLALTWDFDNRLVAVDVDDDSSDDVTFQYDALGRRVQRDDGTDETVFVQNGQQTFADYDSGTAAGSPDYNYVYASYIDEPVLRVSSGGNRYFHQNQQHSVIALTDSSGTIKERYAYTAYGELTITDGSGTVRSSTAEGNRYTYTGREWDEEAELYHFRARMYDPLSGRFLSRDPIGYMDGMSLYQAYFAPASFDPTGQCALVDCKCTNMRITPLRPVTNIQGAFPGFVGGSQPLVWDAVGVGDHQACKAKRWVLDHNDEGTPPNVTVTRHDMTWTPDDPPANPQITMWTQVDANSWKFRNLDAPTYGLPPQKSPGLKEALYIAYIVDSDGSINPACCRTYSVTIAIVNRQRIFVQFSPVMLSPPCAIKAKELQAGNTAQPGRKTK